MPAERFTTPYARRAALVAACLSATLAGLARADDALAATVALLRSGDPDLRMVGIERVRDGLRGATVTRSLAEDLLPTLDGDGQHALVTALADRGDPAAFPGIVRLLTRATDAQVRGAVLLAVGTLGDDRAVPVLVEGLARGGSETPAAQRGLVVVGGAKVVDALRVALREGPSAARPALCSILATRRAFSAAGELAAATVADDVELRRAATRALATLGSADEVPALVQSVLRTDPGNELEDAERALVAVCTAGRDRQRAAGTFLTAFETASATDQERLVGVLGRVGGAGAREVVDTLLADPARRRLGVEALARWPDAAVTDRMMALLEAGADEGERDVILGGLIRIVPLPNNGLDDVRKLDLLRRTMDLCRRDEERRRILERANAIRTVDTLRFLIPYLDRPTLADAACLSVVELAHHQKLRDENKDEFTRALDRVLATSKNEELLDRSRRYKEGRTWNRQRPGT